MKKPEPPVKPTPPRRIHWDEIWNIAKAHHLEEPTESIDSFRRFLCFWWCRKFNRPLKDPLLQSYTLNELLYEFLRYFYTDPDNDPRKELKEKAIADDDEAWVQKMMQTVQANAAKAQQTVAQLEAQQPKPEPQAPIPSILPPGDISTKFE